MTRASVSKFADKQVDITMISSILKAHCDELSTWISNNDIKRKICQVPETLQVPSVNNVVQKRQPLAQRKSRTNYPV